jgi:hypothetical protein
MYEFITARSGKWSLVVFSFLSVVSVSLCLSGLINRNISCLPSAIIFILLAGLAFLFHNRSEIRIWRSLPGKLDSKSALSIELFAVYVFLLILHIIFDWPLTHMLASVAGIIYLISLDNIYSSSSESSLTRFHSGQTFLTALIMTSFFVSALWPFIFIGTIKLAYILYSILKRDAGSNFFVLRFVRAALLFIVAMILLTGEGRGTIISYVIFITGELCDRITFYIDFLPTDTKNTGSKNITL